MVTTAFKIRFALQFLAVAAVVGPVRAGDQSKAIPLVSTQSGPPPCVVDQAKPPAPGPLAPRALAVEAEAPVILDAVLYVEYRPNAGATNVHRTTVRPPCQGRPHTREFGVINRRIDLPRYY